MDTSPVDRVGAEEVPEHQRSALARRLRSLTESAGPISVKPSRAVRPESSSRVITILSANLWHDWPRRRRWSQRLEAFARLAENEAADILLVQESARTTSFSADQWLADRLEMASAYARANGGVTAIGFEEGPAILSRAPLSDIRLCQLSHGLNPLVRRVALGARVPTPAGGLFVVSAHLGLTQRHNAHQVRRLSAWVEVASSGIAAAIGGDFNATESQPAMARLGRTWTDAFRSSHPASTSTTHVRRRALRSPLSTRLDYIFLQQPPDGPWRVLESRHVMSSGVAHSDHLAVLVRLGIDAAPLEETQPGSTRD